MTEDQGVSTDEPKDVDSSDGPSSGIPSSRPPVWRRFGWWVTLGVVLYVVVGAVVLFNVPNLLLTNWFPSLNDKQRAAFIGPAANVVLFALGGTIALVGVGLSLSRHRQELEAAERDRQRLQDDRKRERARLNEVDAQRRIDTERALRERFVTTVKLLSDDSPVNRQAALFALGALADDWDALNDEEEVRVCVEVLTGYLRAPRTNDMLLPLLPEERYQRDPEEEREARRTKPQEVSVKQAGYTVIRNHLRSHVFNNGSRTWENFKLNLTGAHIDFRVDLSDIHLPHSRGGLDFGAAVIAPGAQLHLGGTSLRGSISFEEADLTGGRIEATELHSAGPGRISFVKAILSGNARVDLRHRVPGHGARVNLLAAEVKDRARVELRGATVTKGNDVALHGATSSGKLPGDVTLPSGGRLDYPEILV